MNVIHAFRDGGFAMYWVLGADCVFVMALGVGLAVAYLLRGSAAKWAAVAGVAACAVMPALLGWGGYAYSMSRVAQAVQYADPEFKAQLMEAGTEEAMNNTWFGLGSLGCTVPGVLLLVGVAGLAKPLRERRGGPPRDARHPAPGPTRWSRVPHLHPGTRAPLG